MGCCLERNIPEIVLVSDEAQDSGEESACSSSLNFLSRRSSCSPPSKILPSYGSRSLSPADIEFPELFIHAPSETHPQSSYDFQNSSRLSISAFGSSFLSSMANPPITEVTPQLFLGSFEDARNELGLRLRAITHTISLIGPKHITAGIEHKHYPMNDQGKTDLEKIIDNLWTFVEQSQQPGSALFVHCMLGQNRSATVVIAILMRLKGWSLQEAFKIVKLKRPLVQINENYAKQLSQMEEELHGCISVAQNWMEIRFADMESGNVLFFGDSFMSYDDHSLKEMLEHNSLRKMVDL